MMSPDNLSQMVTSVMLLPVALGTLSGFAVIYILNWLRGLREERDALLGGKVIYTMLFTLGFQVVLSGVGQLVPAIIKDNSGDMNGMQYRGFMEQEKPLAQPLALVTSGGLIGLYALFMIMNLCKRGIGDFQVLLQGLGINAASTGLISCFGLISWMTLLFNEGFEFSDQIDVIWVTFCYFLGHLFCVLPLLKMAPEQDDGQVAPSTNAPEPDGEPDPSAESAAT